MIQQSKKTKRILVIGGGLAGLTAAYKLSQNNHWVTVFEQGGTIGGRCRTIQRNGYSFEVGAQFFSGYNKNMNLLLNELGNRADLIPIKGRVGAWRNSRLYEFQSGSALGPMFSSFMPWASKIRLLKLFWQVMVHNKKLDWQDWDLIRTLDNGESAATLMKQHYDENIMEYLFQPFLAGYWYATPENTSAAMIPLLFKHLDSDEFTFRGGLGKLPERIAQNIDVRTNTKVENIKMLASGVEVTVKEKVGSVFQCDQVICATRAQEALEILPEQLNVHRSFLQNVRYGSSIVAAIPLSEPVRSGMWGILLPRKEFSHIASVVLEHSKPGESNSIQDGKGLLVVTTTDIAAKKLWDESNNRIVDLLVKELEQVFSGLSNLRDTDFKPMVVRHSMAQPIISPGYLQTRWDFKQHRKQEKTVFLAGDYLANVSTEGAIGDGMEVARLITAVNT